MSDEEFDYEYSDEEGEGMYSDAEGEAEDDSAILIENAFYEAEGAHWTIVWLQLLNDAQICEILIPRERWKSLFKWMHRRLR